MIQRIQSLYFFLVVVCAVVAYNLILYRGKYANGSEKTYALAEDFLLPICIIIIGLLAILCLFLFKNRQLQFKLAVLGVVLSIGYVIMEYSVVENFKKANNFVSGAYTPQAFLPVLMIVFFFLAARGVYKDEKLVKSMDRLR